METWSKQVGDRFYRREPAGDKEKVLDKRNLNLLENDKYAFSVLNRILNYSYRIILTDHEQLIICHSAALYPVWVLGTRWYFFTRKGTGLGCCRTDLSDDRWVFV